MEEVTQLIRYHEFDYGSDGITVSAFQYAVIKATPCGVWVSKGWDKKRFVMLSGRKRFAHPTHKEALESFIARKKRQIMLLEYQLERSKGALAVAEEMAEKGLEKHESGPLDSKFLIFDY